MSINYPLDFDHVYTDLSNNPLTAGFLYAKYAGTTNDAPTYNSISALNPVKIPLDIGGRADMRLVDSITYDIYIYDVFSNLVRTRKNVTAFGSSGIIVIAGHTARTVLGNTLATTGPLTDVAIAYDLSSPSQDTIPSSKATSDAVAVAAGTVSVSGTDTPAPLRSKVAQGVGMLIEELTPGVLTFTSTTPVPSGAVTGSGTVGHLSKFDAAKNIVDSTIIEDAQGNMFTLGADPATSYVATTSSDNEVKAGAGNNITGNSQGNIIIGNGNGIQDTLYSWIQGNYNQTTPGSNTDLFIVGQSNVSDGNINYGVQIGSSQRLRSAASNSIQMGAGNDASDPQNIQIGYYNYQSGGGSCTVQLGNNGNMQNSPEGMQLGTDAYTINSADSLSAGHNNNITDSSSAQAFGHDIIINSHSADVAIGRSLNVDVSNTKTSVHVGDGGTGDLNLYGVTTRINGDVVLDKVASPNLTIGGDTSTIPTLSLNGSVGSRKNIDFRKAGLLRWRLGVNAIAESGAGAGSNFELIAYNDDGSVYDTPITINRQPSGTMLFTRPAYFNANVTVQSTSPTISLGLGTTQRSLLTFEGAASWNKGMRFRTAGVTHWELGTTSDTLQNFTLDAKNDSGVTIDSPIIVNRAAGSSITLSRNVFFGGLMYSNLINGGVFGLTNDGNDHFTVSLSSTTGQSPTRGGYIVVKGNEVAATGGDVLIEAGIGTNGDIIGLTNATERFRITKAGEVRVLADRGISLTGTGAVTTAGDLGYDTTRKQYASNIAGVKQYLSGVIATMQTSGTSCVNTTAETSILGAIFGTTTLPANSLTTGRVVRFTAHGRISNTGTPTIRVRIALTTNDITSTATVTMAALASPPEYFRIEGMVTIRSSGVGGGMRGSANMILHSGAGTAFTQPLVLEFGPAATDSVIDTTQAQTFDIKATWGTANAANYMYCDNFILETI